MTLFRRVVQILTTKDIDWIELFVGWNTLGFCLVLLAPGDYFASAPRLSRMEHPVGGLYVPEVFWVCVFGAMSLIQWVAIAVGETPVTLRLWPKPGFLSRTVTVSGHLVRMRAMAIQTGLWLALTVLVSPTAPHLYGVPVSLSAWWFSSTGMFCLLGSLRMAGSLTRERERTRMVSAMAEASNLMALAREVEAMAPMPGGAGPEAGGLRLTG